MGSLEDAELLGLPKGLRCQSHEEAVLRGSGAGRGPRSPPRCKSRNCHGPLDRDCSLCCKCVLHMGRARSAGPQTAFD